MDGSNKVNPVSKGRYVDCRAQSRDLRRLSLEQVMEDPDSFESVLRFTNRIKAPRSESGEWAQPRRMGRNSKVPQDRL